jgi:hypothetical protein
MRLGDAVVYITGDRSGLSANLAASRRETETWARQTGESVNRSLGQAITGGIGSLVGGITRGLGAIGLAKMGVDALAATARQAADAFGIGLNSELENTRARFMAFTKDAALTESILAQVRAEADRTPFEFNEMANATASLIPSARQAQEPLMDLVKTAEILAAANPAQGLEGAAFSLREAVSGDFQSVIERFDLPRSYLNQLKEEGVPALEAVRKAMQAMGYDAQLVGNMATTLSGRWSTFRDTIDSLRLKISQPIFDRLKLGLESLQGWFDRNKESIDRFAARTAAAIETILDGLGGLAQAFWGTLTEIVSLVNEAGRLVYEGLQWLNPFAEHSPSLVSQVDEGVKAILDSYGLLRDFNSPYQAGSEAFKRELQAQRSLVDLLKDGMDAAKSALDRWRNTPLPGEEEADAKQNALRRQIQRQRLRVLELEDSRGSGRARKQAQDELSRLERQLQRLQIQTDLKYGEQRRQIERAAAPDKPEARSLAEILSGIAKAKADEAAIKPLLEERVKLLEAMDRAAKEAAGSLKSVAQAGGAGSLGIDPKASEQTRLAWKTTVDTFKTDLASISGWFAGAQKSVENFTSALRTIRTEGLAAGISDLLFGREPLTEEQERANKFARLKGLPEPYTPQPRYVDWGPLLERAQHDLRVGLAALWDRVWDGDPVWAMNPDTGNMEKVASGGVEGFLQGFKVRLEIAGPAFSEWLTAWVEGRVKAIDFSKAWAGLKPPEPEPGQPGFQGTAELPTVAPKPVEQRPGGAFGLWLKDQLVKGITWALSQYDYLDELNRSMNAAAQDNVLPVPWLSKFLEDLAKVLLDPKGWEPISKAWEELWTKVFEQATPGVKRASADWTEPAIIDPITGACRQASHSSGFKLGVSAIGQAIIDEVGKALGLQSTVREWQDSLNASLGIIRPKAVKIPVQWDVPPLPDGTTYKSPYTPSKTRQLLAGANGLDFVVGGSGGTDSQLVQFLSSPGARVVEIPPGQRARSGGGIVINNDFRGAVVREAADLSRLAEEVAERTIAKLERQWDMVEGQQVRAGFAGA